MFFEPAAQIGESRTVCDNVIDDEDAASRLDLSHEDWLTQDAGLRIGKGVRYNVDLADTGFEVGFEMLGNGGRINDRKSVRLVSIELHQRNDGIEHKRDLLGFD